MLQPTSTALNDAQIMGCSLCIFCQCNYNSMLLMITCAVQGREGSTPKKWSEIIRITNYSVKLIYYKKEMTVLGISV